MEYSKLPQNYQRLALRNYKNYMRVQIGNLEIEPPENLPSMFFFRDTPEGHDFWYRCSMVDNVKELPNITNSTNISFYKAIQLLGEFEKINKTFFEINIFGDGSGRLIDSISKKIIVRFNTPDDLLSYLTKGTI